MRPTLPGLHHITAITADPQSNLDFYVQVLGLRLVKLTVNFDDPGSYHLYYGDESGSPGSIMTFFGIPGAARGRVGTPQATATAFAVPQDSLAYWREHLARSGVEAQLGQRFGQELLSFSDPEGLALELIASLPRATSPAIERFHGVSLSVPTSRDTERVLTEVMGFQYLAEEGQRRRFRAADGEGLVDIVKAEQQRGAPGAGTVHHVAFRTPDDEQQKAWLQYLASHGQHCSPVMDRTYFHSIYFREPSGVLFEIATNPPGFAIDESLAELGQKLMLPAWLESKRPLVEKMLPSLQRPQRATIG